MLTAMQSIIAKQVIKITFLSRVQLPLLGTREKVIILGICSYARDGELMYVRANVNAVGRVVGRSCVRCKYEYASVEFG